MRKINQLLLTAILGLSLAACDQGSNAASSGQQDSLKENVRIGFVHCCGKQDVFMHNMLQYAQNHVSKMPNVTLVQEISNDDQALQNEQLKKLVAGGVQALVVSTVDTDPSSPSGQSVIDIARHAGIPIIFYNHGVGIQAMESYGQAYYVGSIPAQSGLYQGELIIKNWEENPAWDKNQDGIIQYALLKGPTGHPDAEGRSKWVEATITNYPGKGIKAQKVYEGIAEWQKDKAKALILDWMEQGNTGLELIIANNDDMALGAVEALSERNISLPVFGVDATDSALNMIKQGKMAGTVLQDGNGQVVNAVKIGINLAAKRPISTGLDEKIINNQLMVPYVGIDKQNLAEYLK